MGKCGGLGNHAPAVAPQQLGEDVALEILSDPQSYSFDTVRSAGQQAAALITSQAAEIERLREALEWALTNAGADHPNYPYRNEDGKWCFPYLVHGSPMGGGVGERSFNCALEAVQAAALTTGAAHVRVD